MRHHLVGIAVVGLLTLAQKGVAAAPMRCADGLAGVPIAWNAGSAADKPPYVIQGTEISVVGEGTDFAVFQAHAGRVFGALATAPGCIAYGFAQVPGTTTFRTVSLWTDAASLRAFVRGHRHRAADTATRRRQTAPARFGTWEASARPVFWDEVAATLAPLPPRPSAEE